MRLIRITTNYNSYLKNFYAQRPDLNNKDYNLQYKDLMTDCFAWADFWTHALRPMGYEVWETVGNAEFMQKVWAKENGVNFRQVWWLNDIIAAQVKSFQPDILFVDDYSIYTADFIRHLRQECSCIKLVIGWCGAPYNDASVFRTYDIVLSNIPELIQHFRNAGHQCEYVKHAFEPKILNKLDNFQPKNINFSFIGSIFKGQAGHNKREILLEQLVQNTDLEIWSDVSPINWRKFLLISLRQSLYDTIQILTKLPRGKKIIAALPKMQNYANLTERPSFSSYEFDENIVKKSHEPVFGIKMFQTLHNSQLTFNNHIDISASSASNMRLFEATGVGTCLLTDWKENLHELFEPDREVVTYRSVEECIEKVHWLLEHPEEREAIAAAGKSRTLRDHTFSQRAIQLDEIIKTNIAHRFTR